MTNLILFARLFFVLFVGLLFISPLPSFAQNEGRWYTVELLIFKRLGSEAYTREIWRRDIELSYPYNIQYFWLPGQAPEKSLLKEPLNDVQGLSLISNKESYQLSTYRNILKRNQSYQILFHQAWQQQMFGEKDSPAIMVSGGGMIGDHDELSGYIKFHIARYLHLETDLWLITDSNSIINLNTQIALVDEQSWPIIPDRPENRQQDGSITNNISALTSGSDLVDGIKFNKKRRVYPLATFRSKRRMRSKELHYLDHPLMGILVLLTPLETPP